MRRCWWLTFVRLSTFPRGLQKEKRTKKEKNNSNNILKNYLNTNLKALFIVQIIAHQTPACRQGRHPGRFSFIVS
jgi:hypothetical protein